MPTQADIVEDREKRVHFFQLPGKTGTIIKGDIYMDRVTVRWDDGREITHWVSSLHLVYGAPTWINGDAHYRDGSIVTAEGEIR